MRALSLVVAAAVVVSSVPARAEDAPRSTRGALSGVGVALLVLGVTGLGMGLGGVINFVSADERLALYRSGAQSEDAAVVSVLRRQRTDAEVLPWVGLGAGVALLAAGVLCVVLDAPRPLPVAFVPTAQGGLLTLSLPL